MVQRLKLLPYLINSSFWCKVQLKITLRETIFESCVIIETALVLGLQQNMNHFVLDFFFFTFVSLYLGSKPRQTVVKSSKAGY